MPRIALSALSLCLAAAALVACSGASTGVPSDDKSSQSELGKDRPGKDPQKGDPSTPIVPPSPNKPGPEACGTTTCREGEVCCNASCGICTPPGLACVQIVCEDEPAPCYRGGCSGEVCSDVEAISSACIWKPEYACYRTAACGRQPDGKCGWTPSAALTSCLANPPQD